MKNTMKLFGIVALAAAVGFGTMACSAGGEAGIAVTYSEIMLSDGSNLPKIDGIPVVAAGTVLKAYYEPADATDVTYKWINLNEGTTVGTGVTFTPTEYGRYELEVSGEPSDNNVTVTKYIDYYGKWSMKGSDNNVSYDEVAEITDVTFLITDTTNNEWFKFTIESWTADTNTTGKYSKYSTGQKLTGEIKENDIVGYSLIVIGEYKTFSIYLEDDGKLSFVRTTPDGKDIVTRTYVYSSVRS